MRESLLAAILTVLFALAVIFAAGYLQQVDNQARENAAMERTRW